MRHRKMIASDGSKGKTQKQNRKDMEGTKMENAAQELETLLTPEQVKQKLQIGISTVYHLAHKGILPGIKIGGTLRFSPKVLKKYLEDLGKKLYGNAA